MAEDVPMSSTSVNSESVCTNSVLKPSRKSVDLENEMVSKSNTSKNLSPTRSRELDSACKQGAARVGNVKKSSVPSEHLAKNTVSSLDQPSAKATTSNNSPTRSKVACTKASLKKFEPNPEHRHIRHCCSKFSSKILLKAKETSKNAKDEENSATREKEKHDTCMLGECEEASTEGLNSLLVNTIASTLTKKYLEKIALEYHIDTTRYHLSLPKTSERANSYFPSKHTFCIYVEAFKAGLRLPLHPLIPEILNEFRLAPTQITPNSWRVLICFISFCYSQKITPTVNLFRAICCLKYHSGEGNKGWWFFSSRIGFKLFEVPSSNKGWRNKYFKIRTSEGDTLGFNTKWGSPKLAANQPPTLTGTEAKALDDLVATATNNPPDVSVLLSEEALIQAGMSSRLLKSKGSESEMKQHHSLSHSGLLRALKRKTAATESAKNASSGLCCQEPVLIDVDEEDLPEIKRPKESLQPMEQTDLLQQTEQTNRPQEIAPSKVLPRQASPESNVQRITGASDPTCSLIDFNTTEDLPRSNAEVMRTGCIEYTREQSVFTHPALAKQLVSQMVLPHDRDSVAQKDTFVVAQELRCQAMEDATWKLGVSEKLIKMQHEINMLKEERNALEELKKMEATELESARKTSEELQKEVKRLEHRLKEAEENFTKLKRRMKQAENQAAAAKRKVSVAEKKCRQFEMEKSRVAEETLKNYKVSQEFQDEVEEYHAEAYGMGLNVAIEKIKRQFPDLDLSMINFYSED